VSDPTNMGKIVKKQSHKKLYENIKALLHEARSAIARNINTAMVVTYFEIGRMIVMDEQQGKKRAGYAEKTLKNLSLDLTKEFGKGFSERNLRAFRQFYLTYNTRAIRQSPIAKSKTTVLQTSNGEMPFRLSWTHYLLLMRIANEEERRFYEIEAAAQNWSIRELERQFNSSLYERLVLSRDKKKVNDLSKKGHILTKPQDAVKEPYVLEFLGLKEESSYSETDLETAIINKIEHFLLELGKGFLFVGRQKRFTFDEEHFFVDLVFYNRLLRCFVLIDLKIGKLKHQDIGQMQMYVNYYDRMMKSPDENSTIGIILCKEAKKAVVEFTLPKDNEQIFARKYQLYLPSKEELKRQLEE
jgi:predicted nuclease of restriction endonuclease-like (RecB) superfamily